MVAFTTVVAALAGLFASQSLAAAVAPVRRDLGPGVPPSNPPGVVCYNTWETVTNDYWYVIAANAGNSLKADRIWNHLNLNGCAPTENKYHAQPQINGSAVTFHTSEACTAARVSHALRSGSDPPMNIACVYTGKQGPTGTEGVLAGISTAGNIIFGILGSLGGGE